MWVKPSYNPFDFLADRRHIGTCQVEPQPIHPAASRQLPCVASFCCPLPSRAYFQAHSQSEPSVHRHYEDWAETNVCRIGQEGQPKLKESVSTSILDDDPSYSLNFGSPLDFGVSPDSSLYLPRSLNPLPQRCTICQRLGSSGKPVRVWICRATDYGRKESRKVLFVFGEPCVALLAYVYNGKVLRVRGL